MWKLRRMEGPIRAVLYVRVSNDTQDVQNSIAAQISEAKQYAARHNIIIVRIYIEEAETGRTDNRPRFQEMIAHATAKEPDFDIVLVWKFSRFSRNDYDNAVYKHMLKKRGIRVVSVKEPIDDSPQGQLMERVIEGMDAFYSANLSQEVRRGQRHIAERGYYPGHKAPYGYTLEKVQEEGGNALHNVFVVDPKTAPIVRRIFREAIAGRTQGDIRKGLDADGVPTPKPKNKGEAKGTRWAESTIHDILHDLTYAGYIVWGVSSASGDPPVIAKGRHDPIVSEDEFEQAKRVMKSKARGVTHPRQAGSVWMLSGMLQCRKCEANLIIRSSKKGTSRMYKCRTRRYDGVETCDCPNVNAPKLDERFLKAVLEDILCPSNVEAAHRKMSEELTEPYGEQKARLQALEKELLDVEQRKARVMEAYESGAYSVDDYSRRTAPLTKAESDLRQAILETSERLERETAFAAEPAEIMEFAAEVSEFIRNSPPKERKNMLQRFIKCVWIEAGKATVEYRIPLPRDAKRPHAKELVLALDGPVPPTARVSPRQRGYSVRVIRLAGRLDVSPAGAGVSPIHVRLLPHQMRQPRVSGGIPLPLASLQEKSLSAPQKRGKAT